MILTVGTHIRVGGKRAQVGSYASVVGMRGIVKDILRTYYGVLLLNEDGSPSPKGSCYIFAVDCLPLDASNKEWSHLLKEDWS